MASNKPDIEELKRLRAQIVCPVFLQLGVPYQYRVEWLREDEETWWRCRPQPTDTIQGRILFDPWYKFIYTPTDEDVSLETWLWDDTRQSFNQVKTFQGLGQELLKKDKPDVDKDGTPKTTAIYVFSHSQGVKARQKADQLLLAGEMRAGKSYDKIFVEKQVVKLVDGTEIELGTGVPSKELRELFPERYERKSKAKTKKEEEDAIEQPIEDIETDELSKQVREEEHAYEEKMDLSKYRGLTH